MIELDTEMLKNHVYTSLIPVATSDAGQCMTAANWQSVGVHTIACYLSDLLMKPGYDFLATIPQLASYIGWRDTLVLNASMQSDTQGRYTLRSVYDGTRSIYSTQALFELITKLAPNYVILPTGIKPIEWQELPDSIFPFLSVSDLPSAVVSKNYGVYFSYDDASMSFSELLQYLEKYVALPCYIAGDFNLLELKQLAQYKTVFIESNKPANDALHGQLYDNNTIIQIQDEAHCMTFDTIQPGCSCPTCQQQLTRAYLHHLFIHTPLLCQRFLVQHNQASISSLL